MRFIVFGSRGQLGDEWRHVGAGDHHEYHFFGSGEVDIRDTLLVQETIETIRPDAVINCAAFTGVDRAETDRVVAEEINSTAVGNMARVCEGEGIKMVHYSTDYVFPGRTEDRIRYPEGYSEDQVTSPVNWYGKTKLMGEEQIRDSGVSYLIIRTSWLCGRYGNNFVKTMLKLAEERDEINVVNDQWGSPSFTENLVQNTLNLLNQGQEGIFHVTTEGLLTWHQLAEEIFRIAGKEITVNSVTSDSFQTRAVRPKFSKLDIRKLRDVKGSRIIAWQDGLKKLLTEPGM